MLTVDELASVSLLSTVPASELESLARRAADIRLAAGEYSVHEGEERALFIVLAGKIEVTKKFDGVERTIGSRAPGQIYGEVPLALGGVFLGNYRAAEPSRVVRISPEQYYPLAGAAPDVPKRLGALARERIGGLQGLAADAPKAKARVLGHKWDTRCYELRRFLARNQVSFEWLTPDDPELDVRWPAPRPSEDQCPALELAGGETLL